MSSQLSERDLAEFREIFNLVDVDRGGTISTVELGDLMEILGVSITAEELFLMVAEIDENGNGEIDFDEFVQVMSQNVRADYSREEVMKAFKVFADSSVPEGCISVTDLENALQVFGKDKLSQEDARNLLAQIETSGDIFNYKEYVTMMMQ
eukprot:GEMP01122023.1.p1 GENE.GEMP01122023.1~~GEMP01122023.1.p1  ORF type:complete len:174 (+),score=38.30 GEMP01122023.1:71-523(+)